MPNTKALVRDDVAMMSDPLRWPAWPWLPLKKYTGDGRMDCALLHADTLPTESPIRLYKTNLFGVKSYFPYFPTSDMQAVEYASLKDAAVADGWVVD